MHKTVYFLIILIISGCASCRQSSQSAMLQRYVSIEDVFIMRVDDGTQGSRLALVPESNSERGSGYYSSPRSIAKYRSGEEGQTNDVIGVITSGTKIDIVQNKTKKSWSFWYGKMTENTVIYGKIISGPFSGRVVDLNDVLHWPKKWLMPVNMQSQDRTKAIIAFRQRT